MSQWIEAGSAHGVARITLARPEKRNALQREMIVAMRDAVRGLAAQGDVRVLIIAAAGEVFCAGMDLEQMRDRARSPQAREEFQIDSQVYAELVTDILSLPLPVIAAVQGPVLAGGMGLVCACDLVVAADSAYFFLPEPARGITAAMVAPLLMHRIGPGPAGAMLLSMERVSAESALRCGLCHDVVAGEELESRVDTLVKSILAGSREALAITKRHLADCLVRPLPELTQESVNVSARARETADAAEGLAAFLEKRKPRWQP